MLLEWDEDKREANLTKHGLDFVDAVKVLTARERMDIQVLRKDEYRTVSFAYIDNELTVLCLVYTKKMNVYRVISFRKANKKERSVYNAWKSKIFNL